MSADIAGSRRDRAAALQTRELGPEHAEAACDVMHRAFARHLNDGVGTGALHETPSILSADLESGTQLTGLYLGDSLVAIVKSKPSEDGTLYFARLAVAPEAQGAGCAQALIRYLRQRAANQGLDGLSCSVRASSADNIAMYEHLGFRVRERRVFDSLSGERVPTVVMESRGRRSAVRGRASHPAPDPTVTPPNRFVPHRRTAAPGRGPGAANAGEGGTTRCAALWGDRGGSSPPPRTDA